MSEQTFTILWKGIECYTKKEAIKIELNSNFSLTGDLKYLSLALKNLLDNALKYADQLPITLEVTFNKISVYNHGKALKKEFEHLLTPFTREEDSRTMQGFGLGLNIISKIVNKHNFILEYGYEAGYHRFSIILTPF